MITYGAIGGTLPTIPMSSLLGRKSVTGVGITGWRAARPDQAKADIADILDRRANQGRLIAIV
jgi:NADPH2:quinone reductase